MIKEKELPKTVVSNELITHKATDLTIMSYDKNVHKLIIPTDLTQAEISDIIVIITFRYHDNIIQISGDLVEDKIEIILPNEIKSLAGEFYIEIDINLTDNRQITFARYRANVVKSDIDSVDLDDAQEFYFELFDDFVQKVADKSDIAVAEIDAHEQSVSDKADTAITVITDASNSVTTAKQSALTSITQATSDVATKQSDVTSKYNAFDTSVTQAGQTIDEILALQPQFQSVLDETTGKDVISAPEVILARGGAQTLGERLDSDKAEVNAQLAQKANELDVFLKSKGININDFDEPTRQVFLEAQGVDVNYILGEENVTNENIAPSSVTFDKTDFLRSDNLFLYHKADKGFQLDNTGELISAVNISDVSHFIEVKSGEPISTTRGMRKVVFYDVNKNFVSVVSPGHSQVNPYTFQSPGDGFIRVAAYTGYIDNFTIVRSSEATVIGRSVNFKEPLIKEVPDKSVDYLKTDFIETGKNLYNDAKKNTNSFLVSSGDLNLHNNYGVSDYIRLVAGETYSIKYARNYAIYSTSKINVYYKDLLKPEGETIYTPKHDCLIRFSIHNSYAHLAQIEKGSQATSPEIFKYKIPNLDVSDALRLIDINNYETIPTFDNDGKLLESEVKDGNDVVSKTTISYDGDKAVKVTKMIKGATVETNIVYDEKGDYVRSFKNSYTGGL